jgi:hypothetical protein
MIGAMSLATSQGIQMLSLTRYLMCVNHGQARILRSSGPQKCPYCGWPLIELELDPMSRPGQWAGNKSAQDYFKRAIDASNVMLASLGPQIDPNLQR